MRTNLTLKDSKINEYDVCNGAKKRKKENKNGHQFAASPVCGFLCDVTRKCDVMRGSLSKAMYKAVSDL